MLEMLFLSCLVLITAFMLGRAIRRRRKGKKEAVAARSALDLWVEEMIAAEVARKVGTDRVVVLQALHGEPDAEAVSSMERAVRSVQLAFERIPGGDAEVRVELTYEDGGEHVSRKRVPWTELPQSVRDEFTRTAAARVYRPWRFPWSS